MDAFQEAVDRVLGVEGGYVNDPADAGGETNWGITVGLARRRGYLGPMRDMPRVVAVGIYRSEFWGPLRLEEVAALSRRVAEEVFDTSVNFGPGPAVSFLQRALNALNDQGLWSPLLVDGVLGEKSLRGLGAYFAQTNRGQLEVVLLRCLNGLQLADYVRQVEARPASRRFFFGWVRQRVVI